MEEKDRALRLEEEQKKKKEEEKKKQEQEDAQELEQKKRRASTDRYSVLQYNWVFCRYLILRILRITERSRKHLPLSGTGGEAASGGETSVPGGAAGHGSGRRAHQRREGHHDQTGSVPSRLL